MMVSMDGNQYTDSSYLEHNSRAEQNGCRQGLEGYLSSQQLPAIAVARSEWLGTLARVL